MKNIVLTVSCLGLFNFIQAQTADKQIETINLIICNNNTKEFVTQQFPHDACPRGVKPILYVENFKKDYIPSKYILPDSLIDNSSAAGSKKRLLENFENSFTCTGNNMKIYKHPSLEFLNELVPNQDYCKMVSNLANKTDIAAIKYNTPPVNQSFNYIDKFSHTISDEMKKNGMIAIDVSHHQGTINFEQLKSIEVPHKIEMIIMKATEGSSYQDKFFKSNWDAANQNGFIRGAYHFYRPDASPEAQAQNFINQVGPLKNGDLVPVIDLEKPCSSCSDLMGPHFNYMSDLKTFVSIIKKHYKSKVLFYSGNTYYYDYIKGYFPDDYFWIARYSANNKPYDFGNQTIGWQFTDKMRIPGINTSVDTNFFFKSGVDKLLIKK